MDAGTRDLAIHEKANQDILSPPDILDLSNGYVDMSNALRPTPPDLVSLVSEAEAQQAIVAFDKAMAIVDPSLKKDPKDEKALLILAKAIPWAIRSGKKEIACRAVRDWHAYEQLPCKHVNTKVINEALPYIEALNEACGSNRVDPAKFSECLRVYP